MADPQDPPHSEADDAGSPPPDKKPPAKAVKKAAKAPGKKAPAKNPPAKKAPAKKAVAKKAPAKRPEPAPAKPAEQPLGLQQRIETNGQLAEAAKDTAAQAKSTVEAAKNPISTYVPAPAPSQSRVPLVAALAVSLLAVLLVRQLRRH